MCPEHGPRWKLIRNAPGVDVIIVRDERVLLARRAFEPDRGLWELPGGFIELGEHPADAARREAIEELGIRVQLTQFVGFAILRYNDDIVEAGLYEATTADDPVAGDGEVSEFNWFDFDELPPAAEMARGHRDRLDGWLHWRRGEVDEPPALRLG